jgi:pimeloyl-ACP methyl ester carboxylesterase
MLKKLLLYPLYLLLLLVIAWVLWSLMAYRDIPVATLEARYGGDNLEVVAIDEVPLRYRVDGQGPALLLIHSHYYSMRMWDDWIDTLDDHYQVIRFDMTSHGLTGPDSNSDYSMDRDLDHILGLLDYLGVDEFSVVGSSLGGNMAFHLASRYPERVQKLLLANSGGLARKGSRSSEGTIPVWVDYVSYLVPTAAFKAFLQWMIVDDSLVTEELAEEFHQMFRREGNRFAEFNRMRSFKVGEPDSVLAAIKAPTLLMWGEENPQLPVAQVDKFKARLIGAKIVQAAIYPGVGHVIPLEIPQQGSRDVLAFLQADF